MVCRAIGVAAAAVLRGTEVVDAYLARATIRVIDTIASEDALTVHTHLATRAITIDLALWWWSGADAVDASL